MCYLLFGYFWCSILQSQIKHKPGTGKYANGEDYIRRKKMILNKGRSYQAKTIMTQMSDSFNKKKKEGLEKKARR